MADPQRPLPGKEFKEKADPDQELQTMRRIIRALESLPEESRERIIRYLSSRYPVT
jgi:hypothetical protein